jgi:putative ABC transport system permease protein
MLVAIPFMLRLVRFTTHDIDRLRELPQIESVAPQIQLGGWMNNFLVSYESKAGSFSVFGEYPDIIRIMAFQYAEGRFINDGDIAEQRKVAVIGHAVQDELYPPGVDPIGTYLKISGVYFQVIGVTKTLRSGQQGDRDAHSIYLPFTTMRTAFHTGDYVGFFGMTAKVGTDGPEFERQVRATLGRAHKVSPTDKLAIGSFNMFVMFGTFEDVFFWLWAISWIVGGLTLAAGVVGVSNIMLIAVKERTKEFGVRKALGATPGSVVRMVLMETVVLTTIAGLVGIAFGTCVLYFADVALKNVTESPFGPPEVGLGVVVQALGVLVVTATLAGLIPATHASAIKPIEALRTE